MSKKETQDTLPGFPIPKITQWRVNFQYQGPNYALRSGSLVIPSDTIDQARILANGTLKDIHGDNWFTITKIVSLTNDEAPF